MSRLEEKVAEVVEGLSEDEEFRQALIDALPITTIVETGVKDPESLVGKALHGEIANVIENTEVLDGDMIRDAVSQREWRSVISEILRSPQMREVVASTIKSYLEGLIEGGDELPFDEELVKTLGDPKFLESILADESVRERLRDVVRDHVKNYDVMDDDSLMEQIEGAAFSEERVKEAVERQRELIDQKIADAIPDAIDRALEDSDIIDNVVRGVLGSNQRLKDEVDRAVEEVLRDGRLFREAITKSVVAKFERLLS